MFLNYVLAIWFIGSLGRGPCELHFCLRIFDFEFLQYMSRFLISLPGTGVKSSDSQRMSRIVRDID